MLLEPAEPGYRTLDFYHVVDGSGREELLMPARWQLSILRASKRSTVRQHFLKQNGRSVFKFAVTRMAESIETVLARNGLTPADVAMVIPIRPISASSTPPRTAWGFPRSAWLR